MEMNGVVLKPLRSWPNKDKKRLALDYELIDFGSQVNHSERN
jgi:hypothetical protein